MPGTTLPLRARSSLPSQLRPARKQVSTVTALCRSAERWCYIQPLEPMLLPKLRIYFADFPWSHCSIDQRLFTSESGCGYRYGQLMKEAVRAEQRLPRRTTAVNTHVGMWISDGAFRRIGKAPRTAQKNRAAFPMCSDAFLHLK